MIGMAVTVGAGIALAGLAGCQSMNDTQGVVLPPAEERPQAIVDVLNQADTAGKPALVVMDASWCGPCRVYKSQTIDQPAVRAELRERVVLTVLDWDAHPRVVDELNLGATPTTLLFKDGEVVAQNGVMSPSELFEWLEAQGV